MLGLALVLGGCTDKIVYKDLPDFVAPPEGAEGFLGFSDVAAKRTTCGNCHSGKQAQWQGTAHAHAWETLASSGASTTLCEGCHSVSSASACIPSRRREVAQARFSEGAL